MLVTGYVLHPYMPEKDRHAVHRRLCRPHRQCPAHRGCRWMLRLHAGATTMSTDLVAIMSATKMPVILLGFLLAFCIRAAVGSATAAMLTSIAIAGPVCLASGMSPIIAGLSVCLGANAATFPDGRYLLVSVHLQRPRYQRLPRHYDDPLHSVRCHRHGHSGRAQRLLRCPPRNVLNVALGIGKGEYYALTK